MKEQGELCLVIQNGSIMRLSIFCERRASFFKSYESLSDASVYTTASFVTFLLSWSCKQDASESRTINSA